jgi:hypothetical protein
MRSVGEVTLQASFLTPFIANFGRQDPWIWALEALPAYDALARLKSQKSGERDRAGNGNQGKDLPTAIFSMGLARS